MRMYVKYTGVSRSEQATFTLARVRPLPTKSFNGMCAHACRFGQKEIKDNGGEGEGFGHVVKSSSTSCSSLFPRDARAYTATGENVS